MIHRGEGEIRVQRDEWDVRFTTWFTAAVLLVGAVALALSAEKGGPAGVALAVLLVLALGVVLVRDLRKRSLCVIRPDRIGHGSVGGRMRWTPRDEVAWVLLSDSDGVVWLTFYGPSGTVVARSDLGFLKPDELREAFEAAGIPMRTGLTPP